MYKNIIRVLKIFDTQYYYSYFSVCLDSLCKQETNTPTTLNIESRIGHLYLSITNI